MTLKRKGKEIASLDDGAGRNKAIVRYHGIGLKKADQRKRYNILVFEPMSASRYPNRDNVVRMLDTLGWSEMLRPMGGGGMKISLMSS